MEGWRQAGAEVVEMEAATLLALAARRGVAAAVLLAVSDLLADGGAAAIDAGGAGAAGVRLGETGYAALRRGESLTVRRSCAAARARSRSHRLAQGGEVTGDLVQPLLDALGGLRRRRGGHGGGPVLDPVESVLDALEPLRDRAQPARQSLDVRGRRDVQRAHGRLLRLDGLLPRLERARERAVHHGVGDQLLGEPAEGVLALAREAVDERLLGLVGHGGESTGRTPRRETSTSSRGLAGLQDRPRG